MLTKSERRLTKRLIGLLERGDYVSLTSILMEMTASLAIQVWPEQWLHQEVLKSLGRKIPNQFLFDYLKHLDSPEYLSQDGVNAEPNLYYLSDVYLTRLGLKPSSRVCVSRSELVDLSLYCEKHGLKFLLAPYKIVQEYDLGKGMHSNKARKLVTLTSAGDGMYILYIGKQYLKVLLLWCADLLDIHFLTGMILGYPECCCKFYEDNFVAAKEKYQGDFILLSVNSSGIKTRLPHQTNNVGRYFGYGLVYHFPCSYSCRNTIDQIEKILRTVESDDQEVAVAYREKLKKPILYTEYDGIYCFPESTAVNSHQLSYNPLNFLSTNYLSHFHSVVEGGGLIEFNQSSIAIVNKAEKRKHLCPSEAFLFQFE